MNWLMTLGVKPSKNHATSNNNSYSIRIRNNKTCLFLYIDGAYENDLQSGVTTQPDNLVEFLCKHENEDFSEIDQLYQHLQQLNKCEKLEDDFTIIKVKFS